MADENDSQEEITVEVTVPDADPAPAPEAPAVVVVTDAAPAAPAAPDLLSVLLEMKQEITELRTAVALTQETAIIADSKAQVALEADGLQAEEVAAVREEVAEALSEDQASPDDDVEPVKTHWLHR